MRLWLGLLADIFQPSFAGVTGSPPPPEPPTRWQKVVITLLVAGVLFVVARAFV